MLSLFEMLSLYEMLKQSFPICENNYCFVQTFSHIFPCKRSLKCEILTKWGKIRICEKLSIY